MPSIKVKQEYPERPAKDCYQACLKALKEAGYKIFKQRDIGWFVIATRSVDANEVTCNALAGGGAPAFIELNLSAAKLPEGQLQNQAQELLNLMGKSLG